MRVIEYDLFVKLPNNKVHLAKTFTEEKDSLIAYDKIVEDGIMDTVFLDIRIQNGESKSITNMRTWRKDANKTQGQGC